MRGVFGGRIRAFGAGILVALSISASAAPVRETVPGQWLVRTRSGVAPKGRILHSVPSTGWSLVALPTDVSPAEALAILRSQEGVVAVEPNLRFRRHQSLTPRDPHWSRQSALAAIRAPEAWAFSTGSNSVIVAVLDDGIELRHSDLQSNLWINAREAARNSRDDDGNGYVDDIHGADVVDYDGDPSDDFGHGTHVAGIIGAVGNNGRGISGVCWNVRLLPVRVASTDGFADTFGLMKAFDYVVKLRQRGENIRVINCSWGGSGSSQAIFDAMSAAAASGILLCCSAGNERSDNDLSPNYPSGFELPGLIAVAASKVDGRRADFSNFGRYSVDLAAPGEAIWSTFRGGDRYESASGTSMSAPHVSGAAALLFSRYPKLTAVEARRVLLASARRHPDWEGLTVTSGVLDMAAAMKLAAEGAAGVETPIPDQGRILTASRSTAGASGFEASGAPSISADGRWVAFESEATNWVAGGKERFKDVFLKDLTTGELRRVSQTPAGVGGAGHSSRPSVSADGRWVAFASAAPNLVAGDNNSRRDIFLWNRDTGALELISVRNGGGGPGNGDCDQPEVSAEGDVVSFVSDASNLVANDTNGKRDVFVRVRSLATTRRASVGPGGVQANGPSEAPRLSANGQFVAFQSMASNLMPDDRIGAYDVFVYRVADRTTEAVSVGTGGTPRGQAGSTVAAISGDGRWVLFQSYADNLDGEPLDGQMTLFVFDRQERVLQRLPAPLSVFRPSHDAWVEDLSPDGRFVLFRSAEPAWLRDQGRGEEEMLVMDRRSGFVMALAIGGDGSPANEPLSAGRLSADGRFVAVASEASNLRLADGNAALDVFRIDRGDHVADLAIGLATEGIRKGLGWIHPGTPQHAYRDLEPGSAGVFYVRLTHACPDARRSFLRCGTAGRGWSVRCIGPEGEDITSAIMGAGWTTPEIAATGSLVLRIELTASTGINDPVPCETWVTVASEANRAVMDRVAAVASVRRPVPANTLLSRGPSGEPANGRVFPDAINGDGTKIFFTSEADNLMNRRDINRSADVFYVGDRAPVIAEIATAGASQAAGSSGNAVTSRSGHDIAWESWAYNLVGNDTNSAGDVFLRTIDWAQAGLVSVSTAGRVGNHSSGRPSLSENGLLVAFESYATDLVPGDTNRASDIFVHHRFTTPQPVTVISRRPDGVMGNGDSMDARLFGDGRYILFRTFADNLVDGDTNGLADVVLWDESEGRHLLISTNQAGLAANGPSWPLSMSDDGRFVTFRSEATDLVQDFGPSDGTAFLLDRTEGTLVPVSRLALPGGVLEGYRVRSAWLSSDGEWLGVSAESGLAVRQVFAVHRRHGTTILISRGPDGSPSEEPCDFGGFTVDARRMLFSSGGRKLLGEMPWPGPTGQIYLGALGDAIAGVALQRVAPPPWSRRTEAAPVTEALPEVFVSAEQKITLTTFLRNEGMFPDSFLVAPLGDVPAGAEIQFLIPHSDPTLPPISLAKSGSAWVTPVVKPGERLVILLEWKAPATGSPTQAPFEWSYAPSHHPDRTAVLSVLWTIDNDLDGLPDDWERVYWGGTEALDGKSSRDFDADGVADRFEYVAGTDPKDPQSHPSLRMEVHRAERLIWLRWESVAGRVYTLERGPSVLGPFEPMLTPRSGLETGSGVPVPWDAATGYVRLRVEFP
ncbi:MAG: S8 family serine peptidase [Verrucomicrobiales bacterium]|nr:S8 family serine peptidase [Verrucomicrobiales bacterium]